MAKALERVIPAYRWLRKYNLSELTKDLVAGLIVAVVLVPQGMAYALLAGLPPVYGLYASVVPAIVYAAFGTSRHMPVGPPALMALLTFTGVSALAEPGSQEFITLAWLLALMAGAIQLALGLLRIGFVANFIPHPVLSGFIYASAVIIAISQLGNLFGISVSEEHSTLGTLLEVLSKLGQVSPVTLAIGLGSLLAMAALSKMAPRLPAALIAAAGATLAVYLLGLDERGVEVVGGVPGGLPGISMPALNLESARILIPSAIAVAFVGFVESISVAKSVAAREGYKIDSGQELKALGLANVSAAFSSGFPVAGSFSRTAVNYQAGARTQMAPVVAALAILATLLFLTPLFYYLPDAALAAIILAAVYGLLNFKEAKRIFEIRRIDGYALVLTFALTLLLGVAEGIIAGATFALLAFVRRTAYPDIIELGYVEEEDAFLGLRSFPEAKTYPEALIVRFDSPLYYANVSFFEEWLIKEVAARPALRCIILDCRGMDTIDATAVEGLEALVSEYRSRNIRMLLAQAKLPVRERLYRAGWQEKSGDTVGYRTVRDALADAGLERRRGPVYKQEATSPDAETEG